MRSVEELRLASNLIRRGSEILRDMDLRQVPGQPSDLRTRVRALGYEGINLVDGMDELIGEIEE